MSLKTDKVQLEILIKGDKSRNELIQLETESRKLSRELKKLPKDSDEFIKKSAEYKKVQQRMDQLRNEIGLTGMSMRELKNRSRELALALYNIDPRTDKYAALNAEFIKVNARMKELRGSTAQTGMSFSKMAVAGASIAGIAYTVKNLADEYTEAEKAQKKVIQGVKQTGMAAGYSSDELFKIASGLQEITTFGDDEILNEVTAQLLTFTNVSGENFEKAQMAALDLATVLDGDLQKASIQIGKALQDPINGLTTLRRVGISFTDQQKDQIKILQQSGKLQEAQALILAEVNHQYGGQAVAAAEGAGGIKQLQNVWGDLKEDLGGFIVNEGSGVISWLKGTIQWMRKNGNTILQIAKVVASFVAGWMAMKAVNAVVKNFNALMILSKSITGLFKKSVDESGKSAMTFGQRLSKINIGGLIGLITTIIGVTKTLIDVFGKGSAATRMYNEVNERAADIFVEEKDKLDKLVKTATSKNATDEQKVKAIKEINAISPEYLGNITLENIGTKQGTTLINDYVKALEKKARAMAAEELMKEKQKELLVLTSKSYETATGFEKGMYKLASGMSYVYNAATVGTVKTISSEEAHNNLIKDKTARVNEEIEALKALVDENKEVEKSNRFSGLSYQEVLAKIGQLNAALQKAPPALRGNIMAALNDLNVMKASYEAQLDTTTDDNTSVAGSYEKISTAIQHITEEIKNAVAEGNYKIVPDLQEELKQLQLTKNLIDGIIASGGNAQSYLDNLAELDTSTIDDLDAQLNQDFLSRSKDTADQWREIQQKKRDDEFAAEQEDEDRKTAWLLWLNEKRAADEAEFRKKKEDAEKQMYASIEQSAADIIMSRLKARTQKELEVKQQKLDDELAREKARFDRGEITEDQYNKKVAEIEEKKRKADAAAEKKLALYQIALDMARGVMKAIIMNPPTGLPMSAFVLATGAAQAAAVTAAEYDQGLYPVLGLSGRKYNAPFVGHPRTGIYNKPTLGVFAENRPELIVDYPTLRTLRMRSPEVLTEIYRAAGKVKEYADGKYPAGVAPSGGSSELMTVLIQQNGTIIQLLGGINANFANVQTYKDLYERLDEEANRKSFINEKFRG